jgi:hypothetical protein
MTAMEPRQAVTQKIIDFLTGIGIPVELRTIEEKVRLPGIYINHGGLVVDPDQLLYPGDLLHEAGHIAVAPPEVRAMLHGDLDPQLDLQHAGELMAIPWSYAACIHLGIEPGVVFHEHGYNGGGQNLADDFANGRYFGVSTLQWAGMTFEEKNSGAAGVPPFPHMVKWVRE